MKISSVSAYQIFDSRGVPTVEVEVVLENGTRGRGLVPSGASTGKYEALELRDGDATKFRGKSVQRAIENVEREIEPALLGKSPFDQRAIDEAMIALDGTANKSRLGANAILGVSLAVADAAARARGVWLFEYIAELCGEAPEKYFLPLPEIQIFGGGAHAGRRLDVQDFLVIATGAENYAHSLEITHDIFHAAGALLKERGKLRGVADEGGYWPEFENDEEALITLVESIDRAGYEPGKDAAISLDIAASEFFDERNQTYRFAGTEYSSPGWAKLMANWCERFPIISLEDPMAETDWDGWSEVHRLLGGKIQLVGDDLFTTNIARIEQGVERNVANSVLIKLNQIGTLSETLDAIALTEKADWLPLVSARSGETEDAFISHLAVGTNAGQLKVGSFSRSERMAKWNEVLRIERHLGARAQWLGAKIYDRIRASNISDGR
jgi:enolase